jgi:hypothetical protein
MSNMAKSKAKSRALESAKEHPLKVNAKGDKKGKRNMFAPQDLRGKNVDK